MKRPVTLYYFLYLVAMLPIAFIMFYPFIYSVLAGFVQRDMFAGLGKLIVIPDSVDHSSYKNAFGSGMLWALINTVGRTLWFTIYYTLFACMCGYEGRSARNR